MLVVHILQPTFHVCRVKKRHFLFQLCSPAAGNSQHFLLIVSQYIYHVQSLGIPISAMRLLTTIARIFPMSLLACLGSDADAIRDILIFRLESQTEDVKLKVTAFSSGF